MDDIAESVVVSMSVAMPAYIVVVGGDAGTVVVCVTAVVSVSMTVLALAVEVTKTPGGVTVVVSGPSPSTPYGPIGWSWRGLRSL